MWDRNLALAQAALARGLVRATDLEALAPLWLGAEPRDLAALLVERGLITPTAAEALSSGKAASTPASAMEATHVPSRAGKAPAPAAPALPGQRFELGAEIGRGGIGRVVEAADRDLGRTVALKLAHVGSPETAMERFRAEARITGRLEHPNIVPVHEMGELPGTREAYFCMKRILGRNMQEVIRAKEWPLRRLVEAFRDVCRAVAYAHSKGVIHRDLKPANVMLGDFGETLVVDWGLAKARGEAAAEKGPSGDSSRMIGSGSALTVDGDVLGTPAYMPPEQARGRIEDVDERSDVWSLGATLYEILSGKPPFRGKAHLDTLLRVIEDAPAPLPEAPPELAAACFRALSKKKEDRFQKAADLEDAVQAWLDGSQERERRERAANEQVGEALRAMGAWRQKREEAREAAAAARDAREAVKAGASPAEKRPMWQAEDRAKALESEAIDAFSAANAALAGALSSSPSHAEARRLRAELHWARFLEAEETGDAKGALLNRRMAERFNEGSLDAALRGEGTLAVTARAYGCHCLAYGRDVTPTELSVEGVHPWSGRNLADAADLRRDGEPAKVLKLRVHRATCPAAPLEGADAWAWRFEERDRVLVPVTPPGAPSGPPPLAGTRAEAVRRAFGDSAYAPHGPGIYLGRTPVAPRAWPMGSWLLVVARSGFEPARVPVLVPRDGPAAADVTLFRPGEVPAGFLPVAAGPYTWQGDLEVSSSRPGNARTPDDFLIARFPVTCREYAAFLTELAKRDPAEAARRAPRESPGALPSWVFDGKGISVPTAEWKASVPAEVAAKSKPLAFAGLDWLEEWPAFGIDWTDAAAYAKWASLRDGRLYTLPTDNWWEKAARGPDRRTFPWGRVADGSFSNVNVSQPVSMRPARVTDFPLDESPYGARGMGGNMQQWVLDEREMSGRKWQLIRGVSWPQSAAQARSTIITTATREYVNFTVGFRLAAAVRV